MSDVNMVVLGGRVVAAPELRSMPSGTAVASLRIASNRHYRDKGSDTEGWKKKSLFITTESFGKLAERIAARHKKGDYVIVRGRLELNEWTGTDGRTRRDYRIFAENINQILARSNGDSRQTEPESEEEEEIDEA